MPDRRGSESDSEKETRGGTREGTSQDLKTEPGEDRAQNSTDEVDPAIKAVRRFAASPEEGRHPTEIFHAAERTGQHANDEWKKNRPHPKEEEPPINPS